MQESFFANVDLLPPDPILSLPILFAKDNRTQKVNLGIGVYKDENNQTPVLSAVQQAETWLQTQALNKEYQPIEGKSEFIQAIIKLIYGNEASIKHMGAMQALGGTGALRIGFDFLLSQGHSRIYFSNPSWPNHFQIAQKSGLQVLTYPYYDTVTASFQKNEMFKAVGTMPEGSILLLHAGCHNPTGMELSKNDWQELSQLIKERKVIPFFDFAYQGFGLGVEEDAWPIRYFVSQGHEFFVASSFSKNMGLYGERMGALSWHMSEEKFLDPLLSHLKQIARASYSNPPVHGGKLVSLILNSKDLHASWVEELNQMRLRMHEMRYLFAEKLHNPVIKEQQGMFSLMNFTPEQVNRLREEFGIYLLNNGRISIPGLTKNNLDYVAAAFAKI